MTRYVLNDTETAAIGALADRVRDELEGWDPLLHVDRIRAESERLPLGLRQFLAMARTSEEGVIQVANLPVDPQLVPTPASWQMAEKEAAAVREELVLLLVAGALGDPFAWSSQQNGRLVHDVCPSRGQEASLTSASSEAALTLHTEDVFHACRGDYVALMCLRNPDKVGTTVASLDRVALPAHLRKVLQEDRFRFYPDDSHVPEPRYAQGRPLGRDARPHEVAPVLFGPRDTPYLRIDGDFTEALPGDTEAERALRECVELLDAAAERIVLEAGELAFLDNYQVVHGRDVFIPRYDGTDRWLKRTSVVRDLRRTYVHTRSRTRVLG